MYKGPQVDNAMESTLKFKCRQKTSFMKDKKDSKTQIIMFYKKNIMLQFYLTSYLNAQFNQNFIFNIL